MKVLKLSNHLKWGRGRCNGFSDIVGEFGRRVAEEFRALANVYDSVGFNPITSVIT
jgi:hypothetical protein